MPIIATFEVRDIRFSVVETWQFGVLKSRKIYMEPDDGCEYEIAEPDTMAFWNERDKKWETLTQLAQKALDDQEEEQCREEAMQEWRDSLSHEDRHALWGRGN